MGAVHMPPALPPPPHGPQNQAIRKQLLAVQVPLSKAVQVQVLLQEERCGREQLQQPPAQGPLSPRFPSHAAVALPQQVQHMGRPPRHLGQAVQLDLHHPGRHWVYC